MTSMHGMFSISDAAPHSLGACKVIAGAVKPISQAEVVLSLSCPYRNLKILCCPGSLQKCVIHGQANASRLAGIVQQRVACRQAHLSLFKALFEHLQAGISQSVQDTFPTL